MAKFHCLTSDNGKFVLLKDYGDSSKYAVLSISKVDIIIKTDKRIKSFSDFIKLYGYKAVHTLEEKNKALVWNN